MEDGAALPWERGVFLCGFPDLGEHRGLSRDPLAEAWPRQDAADIGRSARIIVDRHIGVLEVCEGAGNRDVRKRNAIADQIAVLARHDLLKIGHNRWQLVASPPFRRRLITRPLQEIWRHDTIEEHLGS